MKIPGLLFLTLAVPALVAAQSPTRAPAPAPAPQPAPRAGTLVTVDPQKLGVLPAEADRRFADLKANVQPSAWAWIEKQARVEADRPAPDPAALRGEIAKRFGAGLPPAEVDAVAFLVLSRANQDLEADMHDTLAHAQVGNQPQGPQAGNDSARRLQTAMDRRSKLIETLSNLAKTLHDTQMAAIRNLK